MREWCKHDVDASEDALMLRVRSRFGHAGYGLWWLIVEQLYRNDGTLDVSDYETVAYAIRVSVNELREFVDYASSIGLVSIEDGVMTNERVSASIDERRTKSQRAASSVRSRYDRTTNVDETYNGRSENVPQRRIREEEEKRREEGEGKSAQVRATPPPPDGSSPQIDDVVSYFAEHSRTAAEAQAFYDHYDRQDWVSGNGVRITKWRSAASKWIADEKKGRTPNARMVKSRTETPLARAGTSQPFPRAIDEIARRPAVPKSVADELLNQVRAMGGGDGEPHTGPPMTVNTDDCQRDDDND